MSSSSAKPVPNAEMAKILNRLAADNAGVPDPITLPPADARAIAAQNSKQWNRDMPDMSRIDEMRFPTSQGHDVAARLFTPENKLHGLILFIHGGGFANGSIESHEHIARGLADESQRAVLSVSYRLAPENPFPAGLDDCITVFRALDKVRSDYPWTDGPVAISGDSAGANLALALMLHEQDKGLPCPDFALLFYGVFTADFDTSSYIEHGDGPGLTRAKMIHFFDLYAPVNQRADCLVAPITATDNALKNLPPLYLSAAEIDPLFSDTQNLLTRLNALGRHDQSRIYAGVTHGFMHMVSALSEARAAITDAAKVFHDFAKTQDKH